MFIRDLYKTAFLVNTDDRHSSGERRIDLNIYYDKKLDLLRLDHNAGYDKILPAEQFTYHIEPEDHLLDLAGEILAITELKHDSGSISCLSYKDNPLALSLGRFCTSNYEIESSIYQVEETLSRLKQGVLDLANKAIILCRHALEHSDQPLKDLTSLIHALGDNGYLLIEIPDCSYQLSNKCIAMLWECHRSYFTEESIENLISLAQGEIILKKRYSYECEDVLALLIKRRKSIDHTRIMRRNQALVNSYLDHVQDIGSKPLDISGELCNVLLGAGHSGLGYMYMHKLSHYIDFIVDDAPDKSNKLTPCANHKIVTSSDLSRRSKQLPLRVISSLKPHKTRNAIDRLSAQGLDIVQFYSIFEAS